MLPVLVAMVAGMIAGRLLRRRPRLFSILDPATGWVIRLLLFLLGWGIGGDAELITRIPELGLQGLVLAAAGIAGSVAAARFIVGDPEIPFPGGARDDSPDPAVSPEDGLKAAGTGDAGPPDGETGPESALGEAPGGSAGRWKALGGSLAAAAAFLLGLPAGMLSSGFGEIPFDPATPVLYVLMLLVGIGAGADPTAGTMVRKHGLRLILLPLAVILGTFAGSFLIALAWPALPIRESLAVGAGFGYYSLSSLVIRELSGGDWAAVALLSNIAREILTLLTAPLLVRVAGPAAPAAAGGATSMDTTLAATVQSSGRAWAVPALFSGVVLTVLVPFAVTLVMTIG